MADAKTKEFNVGQHHVVDRPDPNKGFIQDYNEIVVTTPTGGQVRHHYVRGSESSRDHALSHALEQATKK